MSLGFLGLKGSLDSVLVDLYSDHFVMAGESLALKCDHPLLA